MKCIIFLSVSSLFLFPISEKRSIIYPVVQTKKPGNHPCHFPSFQSHLLLLISTNATLFQANVIFA